MNDFISENCFCHFLKIERNTFKIEHFRKPKKIKKIMQNSFFVHLHIRMPTIIRSVEVDSNPGETLNEIKSRLLSSFGILDPDDWNFFAIGENYVQLDGNMECNKIAFIHAEMLYLYPLETRPITILYNGKAKDIAIGLGSPLSSICPTLIQLFHISDEESFFFMDPVDYKIEPIDQPTDAPALVFKPFELSDRSFLFRTDKFPANMVNSSLPLVSKVLFVSNIKTFITNLKLQECNFPVTEMSEDKLTQVYDAFLAKSAPSLTPEESSNILFTILCAFENPLIPKDLLPYIAKLVNVKNQCEVFKNVYILLAFLPMSSHCILLELCQALSPSIFQSPSEKSITAIMHHILFKNESIIDREAEMFFTKFFLYYGPYLMHVGNFQHLRIINKEKLALTSNKNGQNILYSLSGIEKLGTDKPYHFSIDLHDFCEFCLQFEDSHYIYDQIRETNNKINQYLEAVQHAKSLLRRKNLLHKPTPQPVHYIVAKDTIE